MQMHMLKSCVKLGLSVMSIQEWTNMLDELQMYLFIKMCAFFRCVDLPIEYWAWLDQNIFNGAL